VPKQQQKPAHTEAFKSVSSAETKTNPLDVQHTELADVRQAPDERTAPQSPSSEQQLSPVLVTPVSPSQYIMEQSIHPVYMHPPAGYAYVPGYYYPFVPQPMPYYYYPHVEYYPTQTQGFVDARGQVYYDLEPQLMQQQIRERLLTQPTQPMDDKENNENQTELPAVHTEQKFAEVIKIHETPNSEQLPAEHAPAASTVVSENTQPLSTDRSRSKSSTILRAKNAPKTKKTPVWVPKSTVKTTVTPANVS